MGHKIMLSDLNVNLLYLYHIFIQLTQIILHTILSRRHTRSKFNRIYTVKGKTNRLYRYYSFVQ